MNKLSDNKKKLSKRSDLGNKFKNTWIAYVFLAPVIIVMGILVFYPLFKGIGYSFTNINQYNMGNKFIDPSYGFIGLENYKELLGSMFEDNSVFGDILKQTLVWTFVNVFFHFSIGLGLALLLNRKMRFRSTYRLFLLVPWAIPSFISAFSWRWMFNGSYGIINLTLTNLGFEPIPWLGDPFWSMIAVIMTNVWLGIPFMMVTLLGGLQSIPTSLYEAARVDGASRFRQFWHITLPLLKPVAFTVTLLGIIWTFNMFNIIFLVTGGGPVHSTEILVTYAYREAFMNWDFGIASTYGVIILSFLLIFSTIYAYVLKRNDEGVYY